MKSLIDFFQVRSIFLNKFKSNNRRKKDLMNKLKKHLVSINKLHYKAADRCIPGAMFGEIKRSPKIGELNEA